MEMSYGEKSSWVSLVTLAGACVWYLNSHAGALIGGALDLTDMLGAIIGLVILIVIVEMTIRLILGLESARKKGVQTDERDALIDARSNRWPYILIFAGAIAGIWTAAYQSPIVTAHVLLAALMSAEVVKLIAQLVYYRRGV